MPNVYEMLEPSDRDFELAVLGFLSLARVGRSFP